MHVCVCVCVSVSLYVSIQVMTYSIAGGAGVQLYSNTGRV